MAFSIPNDIFGQYKQAADNLIDNEYIGKNCILLYPDKIDQCPNCIFNSFGGGTPTNVYKAGGPIPFSYGPCPYCGGKGRILIPSTEVIRLRVYWSKKDWIKVAQNIEIPDATAMTIGYLTDLPKCEKANEIILNSDQSGYKEWRFKLAAEPFPHGFGGDRYFIAFWKRSI